MTLVPTSIRRHRPQQGRSLFRRTPIAVAIAAVFIAVPVVFFSAAPVRAGEPIEVDSPAGEDPPSQVLEIPQSCTLDGAPIECDHPDEVDADDSGANAEAASVQNAEQTAGANTATAAAAKPSDSDVSDQTANADWGTVQDYQNQADGPMVSSAVPYGTGTLPNEAYARPPIFVTGPVPIGPFVGAAGPFVPRVIAAPGPIMMPRNPWIFPSRPIGAYMMNRPMAPAGMPRAFRIR